MRLVVFTSNALRHKYLANSLAELVDDAVVISETKPADCRPVAAFGPDAAGTLAHHFAERYREEERHFGQHKSFLVKTMPVPHGEVNLPHVFEAVNAYDPDAAIVFGASLIKEPLLSRIPAGKFINLHLGLSPYYRGSGTNFWPFVNRELHLVGATLLHINAGVDTGDIIAHVRPDFAPNDTVHSAGCKTIHRAVATLAECLKTLAVGKNLPRVTQWRSAENEHYYRKKDVTEDVLRQYRHNIASGMVEDFVAKGGPPVRLVEFPMGDIR